MKREIKFRGKRVDNKEWVEGGFGILGGDTDLEKSVIIVSTLDTNSYVDRFYFTDVEVTRESVCQFTGLKDKNGIEIYEGDICNNCNETGVITWLDDYASYGLREYKDGQIISDRYPLFRYYELEIIGNIHDNPELLK